jgi:aspartate racemase
MRMNEILRHKTCGIIGGMGPYATCQYFKTILDNTPAKKDWEHLRLLIDNNVYIPSRTRSVLYKETSPVKGIIKSINDLASIGADFVVVPCNSAHYFYNDVKSEINVPWLNMLEIVSDIIALEEYSRPLILGGYITTEKQVYDEYLNGAFYLSAHENRFFESVIEEIKVNSCISNYTENKMHKILLLYKQRYDCIVLGCTEYSLIKSSFIKSNIPIFDSTTIYAKEAVRYAKSG